MSFHFGFESEVFISFCFRKFLFNFVFDMKPKKNIGRKMLKTKEKKAKRMVETPYERENRLRANRSRLTRSRMNETIEERNLRLDLNRLRIDSLRASETSNERYTRVEEQRLRSAAARTAFDFYRAAFRYDNEINYSLLSCVIIGSMNKICEYCKALKFKNEKPAMCCANGKVELPALISPPEPLLSLVSGVTSESKHFLTNIRKYNACFQMTSFGATKIMNDYYMPTFKIQGQIYHRAGSLLPSSDGEHKFLQIYFMGNEIEQVCYVNNQSIRTVLAIKYFSGEHKLVVIHLDMKEYAFMFHVRLINVVQSAREHDERLLDHCKFYSMNTIY